MADEISAQGGSAYGGKNQEVKNSMVEIFVNFLSFLLLGIIATAAGILYFQIINKYFPDILSGIYQNYQFSNFNTSLIHYSIASIIVGFPIYLWALWFWFKSFSSPTGEAEKVESRLSKWFTYIVLLIAGGTVIGDLITVIYNFLQGEFGARFLLKALVILVIAGFVFAFYFLERKKIQYKKEVSQAFFWVLIILASVIVIFAIVLGFIVGGTPFESRLKNLDLQRVNDLTQISQGITQFAYDNSRLPINFSELKDNARYNYYVSKTNDPETNKEYEYRVISQTDYELCAEFSLSTFEILGSNYPVPYGGIKWTQHGQGRICEKQTVTFGKPLPAEKLLPAPAR